MKHNIYLIIRVFLALVLFQLFPKFSNADVTIPLNILTFNIRYGSARDGENSWEKRKDAVFEVLSKDYDFFLLQEVEPNQFHEIESKFWKYNSIYRTREVSSYEGEGTPIFYRTERWEILDSGTFWLSDKPNVPGSSTWGNSIPRIVTWGRFKNKNSNQEVVITNTHLDYEFVSVQKKSTNMILRFVNQFKLPVILGGDFNADYKSLPIGVLRNDGFKDAFQDQFPGSKIPTYHGWTGTVDGDQIDFLFFKDRRLDAQVSDIITQKIQDRFPSDHYPVEAFLKVSVS